MNNRPYILVSQAKIIDLERAWRVVEHKAARALSKTIMIECPPGRQN